MKQYRLERRLNYSSESFAFFLILNTADRFIKENGKGNNMANHEDFEAIKDRQSSMSLPELPQIDGDYIEKKYSAQCKIQDGYFLPKNVNLALEIVCDLLTLENTYIPVESVENDCAQFVRFSRAIPILYRGTIADVQNG